MHFICMSVSLNYLEIIPDEIFKNIHEYTQDLDSLLFNKNRYDSNLISTSRLLRTQTSTADIERKLDISKCEHNPRQIVLRQIVRSIDSNIVIKDTACVKLQKRSGMFMEKVVDMSSHHIDIFWKWFVLYGSIENVYNDFIDSLEYEFKRKSIIFDNGLCSLLFMDCNHINNGFSGMIILTSIIKPINNIYKAFGDGNDGLSSITIDTRQFDNKGKLISNDIITNIDFNKLALSPKLNVVIFGYNVEYESNNIFPDLLIGSSLEIWFVSPTKQYNSIDLSKVILNTQMMRNLFYHQLYFGEIGLKKRHMTQHLKHLQIVLPKRQNKRIDYIYAVSLRENTCYGCNFWRSCQMDIKQIHQWRFKSWFSCARN